MTTESIPDVTVVSFGGTRVLNPELIEAIENVMLILPAIKSLVPREMLTATSLPDALRFATGPGLTMWMVWNAIQKLEGAWMASQPPAPTGGHSVDRSG